MPKQPIELRSQKACLDCAFRLENMPGCSILIFRRKIVKLYHKRVRPDLFLCVCLGQTAAEDGQADLQVLVIHNRKARRSPRF